MPSRTPLPDLNIDLGERPDEQAELYTLAHRINVGCGGHAGDAGSMRAACALAARSGVLVGAHPSYPDREHFGRTALVIEPAVLKASIEGQCQAFRAIAQAAGLRVVHMKPHGALYHSADRDSAVAELVMEAATGALDEIAVVGPPDGELSRAAARRGLRFLAEGFADRGYDAGRLLARGTPGSLIEDPAIAASQAHHLADTGRFQTICVHSDTPNAVAIARAVRAVLEG